jgi:hypothetical protein
MRVRLTEIPWYIGPCVLLAGKHAGKVDVIPQGCSCTIKSGHVAGLYEIGLCEKDNSLAESP